MEDLKKTGVYKIINDINKHIYVGSAAGKFGVHQRFMDHKKNLRKGSHHNIYLQRSWDKHGERNFSFEVVEFCDKELCIEKEQYLIDTLSPEYNICKTAGNTMGVNCEDHMTPEAIIIKRAKQSEGISKALKGKTKSTSHATKCGAKTFNVYKAKCIQFRSKGKPSIYEKGEFIRTWLKRSECSIAMGISDKLIRRCLQGKRPQTCGFIFKYTE